MKLTIGTIRRLVKEAIRESMMGSGAYYRREKSGDLISLPDDSNSFDRDIQQQISDLTEDGTIEVVEDMEKNRIEFYYRDEDGYMTYAGHARFGTSMEEILMLAKMTKEYAETV